MSLSEQIHATEAAIAASDARLRVWRQEARRTVHERLMPSRRTLAIAGGAAALTGVFLYRRRARVGLAWRRLGRYPTVIFLLRNLPVVGPLLPLPSRSPSGRADEAARGSGLLGAALPLLWPVALRLLDERRRKAAETPSHTAVGRPPATAP